MCWTCGGSEPACAGHVEGICRLCGDWGCEEEGRRAAGLQGGVKGRRSWTAGGPSCAGGAGLLEAPLVAAVLLRAVFVCVPDE